MEGGWSEPSAELDEGAKPRDLALPRIVSHGLHHLFDRFGRYGARELNDLKALHVLAPLGGPYIPWNAIAMRPAGVVAILNEIVVNARSRVVECGAGISTLYIARLLRDHGGHLHSVEHDEHWAAFIAAQLHREGLGEHATIIHAPLEQTPFAWGTAEASWYGARALEQVTAGEPIDLLVVDGPPGFSAGHEHARYPAVPALREALANDYAIILDDINRRGEQEIVERWQRELGITFERRWSAGRIAAGRSRGSFAL